MLKRIGRVALASAVLVGLAVGSWGVASLAGGGEVMSVLVFAVALCALEVALRPRRG